MVRPTRVTDASRPKASDYNTQQPRWQHRPLVQLDYNSQSTPRAVTLQSLSSPRLHTGHWVASAPYGNSVSTTYFPPPPHTPAPTQKCSANSSLAGFGLSYGKSLFSTSFLCCCCNSELEDPRMSQKTSNGSHANLSPSLQKYLMTTYYVSNILLVALSSNCHLSPNSKRSQHLHPTTCTL